MEPSARTLVRVLFTVAGGVMVVLGLLAVAYGVWFPDMFAIFDLEGSLWLGIAATLAGVVVFICARRRLGDRSDLELTHHRRPRRGSAR
jgi:membrane protein implicated in regulation of membrane protease activity